MTNFSLEVLIPLVLLCGCLLYIDLAKPKSGAPHFVVVVVVVFCWYFLICENTLIQVVK